MEKVKEGRYDSDRDPTSRVKNNYDDASKGIRERDSNVKVREKR